MVILYETFAYWYIISILVFPHKKVCIFVMKSQSIPGWMLELESEYYMCSGI